MKVAAVQFAPILKEPERNLRTAAELVIQAAREGAELVVLPELCTTGYSFMSRSEAEPFAEDLDGDSRSMKIFSSLALRYNVAIAWGVMEKGPEHLHNSQVLVLPNGKHWVCRKLNRWANDMLWAESGDQSPPIAEFRGKTIGLLICRDVRDKSADVKEFYEPGDADIVAFSSNFGDGGFPSVSWHEFATENKTWLVVSNRYGREQNNDFGEGGICVISPKGEVFCDGLKWNAPCIVYADVP